MHGIDDLVDEVALDARLAAVCRQQAKLVALGCHGEQCSYGWLDQRAAHIAEQLTDCGVRTGDRVGLYIERSAELPAAMLACIRIGVCFVPLVAGYPPGRLRARVHGLGLQLVLTSMPLRRLFSVPAHCLQPGLASKVDWQRLDAGLPACLLLGGLDGSGRELISRRALADYLQRTTERMEACAGSRWLCTAPLTDSAALLEWLGPLWVGGHGEIVPVALRQQPMELAALLRSRRDINTLQGDARFWRLLLRAGWEGHRGFTALCHGGGLDRALAGLLHSRTGQLVSNIA